MIIGFFYFNEGQRHAVDKQRDIRPELVVTALTGQFRYHMKTVVAEVAEVDQFYPGTGGEHPVKWFTQVFIVQRQGDIFQQPLYRTILNFGIDAPDTVWKQVRKNIGALIMSWFG